jgi:tetratricopeptide (TPR) repeat protein
MNRIREPRHSFLLCGLLVIVSFLSFWPLLHNGFIKFDDGFYVVHNPHVVGGLTAQNVSWAFSSGYQGNWHPLTWLSHMLDVELFGLKPGWHHLVNLLFHAANSVLLMALFRRMTGAPWRSFFVAALFALHPLHVESVAWAAERKDVLSTFFFVLTLLAYVVYVRAPTGGLQSGGEVSSSMDRRKMAYGMTLALFALALMSKPMVVTTPFVMLLLDFWPLGRLASSLDATAPNSVSDTLRSSVFKSLVREKIPFFGLAMLSCLVTYFVQQSHRAMYLNPPFGHRLANAAESYWRYLGHSIWPMHLAIFYPFPAGSDQPSVWLALGSLLGLATVSGIAIVYRRQAPWFSVGWFWYLGTLVPTIGIIQVGGQAMADRYTYLPLIGIFICLVWGAAALAKGNLARLNVAAGAGALVLVVCAVLTFKQASCWRSDLTVFEHALAVTRGNALAHYHVGIALRDQGRNDDAMLQFRAAIEADPSFASAYTDAGSILENEGKEQDAFALYEQGVKATPWAEQIHNHMAARLWADGKQDAALEHYAAALRCDPDFADAHFNLGLALSSLGKYADAARHFREVCRLKPDDTEALGCLAESLLKDGRMVQATSCYRELTRLAPTNASAHQSLGLLLVQQGDFNLAMKEFNQAVQLKPDWPEALNAMAWLLATNPRMDLRNGAEAVQLAERACQLSDGKQARFWSTLDVAYAEAGRFMDAIAAASKAESLAEAAGQTNAAKAAQARIEFYRQGKRP